VPPHTVGSTTRLGVNRFGSTASFRMADGSGGRQRSYPRSAASVQWPVSRRSASLRSIVCNVHQHGACITGNRRQSMGRSRGGLTSKIHALVDTNGLPVRLALTAGEAHDNRLAGKLLSRMMSGQCCWRTVAMTPIGSEPLFVSTVLGRTSHQKAIGQRRYASVRISTVRETWSSGSSGNSAEIFV
jgi:hypothetical protein